MPLSPGAAARHSLEPYGQESDLKSTFFKKIGLSKRSRTKKERKEKKKGKADKVHHNSIGRFYRHRCSTLLNYNSYHSAGAFFD